MSQLADRRMWSTTPRRLSAFIGSLRQAFPDTMTVRNIQRAFQESNVYPARDGKEFCVPAAPPTCSFRITRLRTSSSFRRSSCTPFVTRRENLFVTDQIWRSRMSNYCFGTTCDSGSTSCSSISQRGICVKSWTCFPNCFGMPARTLSLEPSL